MCNTNCENLKKKLSSFIESHKDLYDINDYHRFYKTFTIPKRSGYIRTFHVPNKEIAAAHLELRNIFLDVYDRTELNKIHGAVLLCRLYIKRRYYTKEFILGHLAHIFPFSVIMETKEGCDLLDRCLDLCMLDGVLVVESAVFSLLDCLITARVNHILP